MDRDEFETLGQQRKQRLVSQFPQQLDRVSPAKKKQERLIQENLDTVPKKSKNWLISGILVGLLAVTAAVVGAPTKEETASTSPSDSTTVTEPATTSSTAPRATSSAEKEREGQILLEQAKLVANQSQPQQIAEAIEIAKKLPPNTSVSSEAQSLTAIWSQKILQDAKTKASRGKLTEAIEVAKLVPAKTKAYSEAQKQVNKWEQQQRQAKEKKFAATLALASQLPPAPPKVSLPPPPPVAPLPTASKSVAPAISVSPKLQPASRAQTPVTNSSATTNVNQSKLEPAVQSKRKNPNPNNQGQLLAQDPYLNVKIPQVNVPQLQPKTIQSSRIALNSRSYRLRNNYGFRNMTVKAPTVAIQLRDNVDEDGDYVSLVVNGKVYVSNQLILNQGRVFMVELQPGQNRVDIVGVKDGKGGITIEVNVAGIGNINNRPIPEGSTASFIINREE